MEDGVEKVSSPLIIQPDKQKSAIDIMIVPSDKRKRLVFTQALPACNASLRNAGRRSGAKTTLCCATQHQPHVIGS